MRSTIQRTLFHTLKKQLKAFPVVSITGPRQSGKTTLVKQLLPDDVYVNLEEPDVRLFALKDPRGFLDTYTKNGVKKLIIDEAQRAPELFSYIQVRVDTNKAPGQFVLTGSQNFLLNERITTLAGRIYNSKLLPIDMEELHEWTYKFPDINTQLYRGFYPRILAENMSPDAWYPNYIETYLERDVRLITQVTNLNTFHRFVRLCAGRTGQILNLSSLALDCGISHTTARSWISLLEQSYIIFLLEPYYKNFNKRIIKAPKIHFFDSGLVCSLLGIKNPVDLAHHYLRGSLFESMIVSEVVKSFYHHGDAPRCYYWRDKTGHEIDLLVESGTRHIPIEIKAGKTVSSDDFKNLDYWNKLSGNTSENTYIIYGGEEEQKRTKGNIIGWKFRSKFGNLPVK